MRYSGTVSRSMDNRKDDAYYIAKILNDIAPLPFGFL